VLPDGELPPELAKHDPKLIEQVCNEVIDASGGVAWEDIAGLETAKHLIKEIVVWPMLNPQIFTVSRGVASAWCMLSRVRMSMIRMLRGHAQPQIFIDSCGVM
jgi:hypothetical protein